MTGERCALCGARVGDRRCPALGEVLCSACCGAHRGTKVLCPPNCVYGRASEERLRERRARELERAWATWYRDLAAEGREGLWPYVEILGEALSVLLHRALVPDAEVEDALRHLYRALSPVVLVPASPPPMGRALAEEGLLVLVREGKLDGGELRAAVQGLVGWLGGYRLAADPFRFVRGLLGLFPPQPAEPEGLIVRPRGTG